MNYFKLTLLYLFSSLTSYLMILLSGILDISNFFAVSTEVFDFCICFFVITIMLLIFGFFSKNINISQIITFIIIKVIFFAMILIFEGSFIEYISIFIDSLFVYTKDFVYCVSDKDALSYAIAILLSCVYPITVYSISNFIRIKTRKNKKIA